MPDINAARLKREIANASYGNKFTFLEELCESIAKGKWATDAGLHATAIAALLQDHNLVTLPSNSKQPVSDPVTHVAAKQTPAVESTPKVTTFAEGGKGRKQCLNCKQYVGVRTAICACGNVFKKSESKASVVKPVKVPESFEEDETEELEQPEDLMSGKKRHVSYDPTSNSTLRISTPAGDPPHRLQGTSAEEVEDWVEKVRTTGLKDRRWYMTSALKSWVRRVYPVTDRPIDGKPTNYQVVCSHLMDIYGE